MIAIAFILLTFAFILITVRGVQLDELIKRVKKLESKEDR